MITKNKRSDGVMDKTDNSKEKLIVVGVRVRFNTLAKIAMFLEENGMQIATAGGILRNLIEVAEGQLKVPGFPTEMEALKWLESRGIFSRDNTSMLNRKRAAQSLGFENLKLERELSSSPGFQKSVDEAVRLFNKNMNEEFENFTVNIPDKVDFDNLNPPEEGSGEIITLLPKG